MEQHRAISKMMLSIKMEEFLPTEYFPYVQAHLQRMFVVGWEQARKELCAHHKKRIGQFNKEGTLLNEFGSLREAAKKTGFKETGLYSAVLRGSCTRQGYYWKYIDVTLTLENRVF